MPEDTQRIREELGNQYFHGLYAKLFGDVGKYASLVAGVHEVVKDEPKIEKVAVYGLAFLVSSFLSMFGNDLRNNSMGRMLSQDLKKNIEDKK